MKSWRERFSIGFVVFILAAFFLVAIDTDLRKQVRTFFHKPHRVILAVAKARLDGSGFEHHILKIRTNEGLFLEVYGLKSHPKIGFQNELLATVKLPDKRDGYFTFGGQVTNLAIDDVDNDQKPEILATSFDNDLVAHLNVYRYLPGNKELSLVKLN